MAVIYDDVEMFDESLHYYQLSLEINSRISGIWNSATALNYNNYAIVLEKKGNRLKALEYFSLAYYIDKNIRGTNHPESQMIFTHLAQCFTEYGSNYGEFLQWYFEKEKEFAKSIPHFGMKQVHSNEK